MASYAGAYGAGAASDELHRLLADKFTREKFAEEKRRTKSDEDAREKDRSDRSEYARQERVARMQREESERGERYEDRVERSRQFNSRMQQDTTNAQVRAKERADDRAWGLDDREARRKAQIEDREDRQAFEQRLMAARGSGEPERKQWLNRGGKVVYDVPRDGDTPQSTREQGRPVTSGDAGRVTDFDTSLADLGELAKNLPKGSTGLAATAGAAVPDFVTEFTGIGTVAKQKQAMIDRVKQVIGKALEGGVLRKEDEVKYAKILPTIGDPDDIVQAKLQGLEQAIGARRGVFLDNLNSAGFDTTRFSSGGQTATGNSAAGPAPGTRRVIQGQPAVWDGQGWVAEPTAPAGPPQGAGLLMR